MSWQAFWRMSIVALVPVGLTLGTCLTELAEAAARSHQVCAVVKGDEISRIKTPYPSLCAVPLGPGMLPGRLLQSRSVPLDLAPDVVSASLGGDLFSRAPPIRL
jgi:hypothetical protein